MLSRRRDERPPLDPLQPMAGKCPACGTVVHCAASECRMLDSGFGPEPCAGCPKVVYDSSGSTNWHDDLRIKACGTRVRMSPIGGVL